MAKKTPAKPARKPAKAAKKATRKKQTPRKASRVDLFVAEYLKDLNGRQAAIRAGYSPQSARQTACDLLSEAAVQLKVQAAMDARAQAVGVEGADVVKRLWMLSNADPRELIELHRVCCRYCWGKGHLYQRTRAEMERAKAQNEQDNIERARKGEPVVVFSEAGGIGYNPKHDPHPDCPECFGDGEERVMAKDTRDLSPAARMLYAGVKTTQHGLEVKMHDSVGSLVNLGRHYGIFKEKVEVTGKDGKPIKHSHAIGDVLDEIDGAGTGLPAHARGS